MYNKLLLAQYAPLFIFWCVVLIIAIIATSLPFLAARRNSYEDKLSPYECGFTNPVEPRHQFDVKFYLVAIMFIIFDIEIAIMIPWALVIKKIGSYGFWSMISFMFLITVGFFYELLKGAMDW